MVVFLARRSFCSWLKGAQHQNDRSYAGLIQIACTLCACFHGSALLRDNSQKAFEVGYDPELEAYPP
ncbi:hypothetical protein Tco_0523572 [Tanacetum coccineum]